ncbi:hypothetical protein D1012_01250 [Pseudotabrizicola alkalilacus]|uniref:Uncharacterized protein n=2 Tax=Pseudotabrizicola alkalilacus TaxID=2305252 RepID=A0A411Z6R1_9RHOB|nr:hypothetical protein D1012_01250 [Pseudotabrizicola alkalilacus]
MMHVARITVPTVDVFTTTELAAPLRIDPEDSHSMIEAVGMAAAAVQKLEQHGSFVALITQTIRLTLDQWAESNRLCLPIGPAPSGSDVTFTVYGEPFTGLRQHGGLRPAL